MKTLHTFLLLLAFTFSQAQTPSIVLNDVNISYGQTQNVFMGASSDSPGKFAYSIANDSIGTINQEGIVTILRGGTTTVTVSQEASGSFSAGSKTATLKVDKAYVYSVQISSADAVNTEDSLQLMSSSGYAETKFKYSIVNQSGTNATVKGATLYAGSNGGTLDIVSEVVADDNFIGSTSSSTIGHQTISVFSNSGTPNLTMADVYKTYGDPLFRIVANSNSNGAITFSKLDGTGATVDSDGLVTITGAGTVTIQATQAADGLFVETSTTATLYISKANAIVNYTGVNYIEKNDSTILTATTNPAGATITWTLKSQPGTDANIKNDKLYAGSTNGSLNIAAEILADDNFNASTSSSTIGNHTVLVHTSQIPTIVYENRYASYDAWDFYMHATSNSNGIFTYSIDSGTAATISKEGAIHIVGMGTVKVKAMQAASPPFLASSKTAIFSVIKLPANFYNTTTTNLVVDDTINLTGDVYPLGAKIIWKIDSQEGTNASITGSKLYTGSNKGTVVVLATVEVDTNLYNPASFRVPIQIDSAYKPTTYFYASYPYIGQEPYKLSLSSNSNGVFTYRIENDSSISIASDGTVTVKKIGVTKVFVSQEASKPYASIQGVISIFVRKRYVYGISITSPNKVNINDSLTLTGITNPAGAKLKWRIKYDDSTGAYIKGSKLYTGSKIGSLDVIAEVIADEYFESTSASPTTNNQTITIYSDSGTPTMIFDDVWGHYVYNSNYYAPKMLATSNSTGAISYSILDEPSATISSDGVITFKNLDSLVSLKPLYYGDVVNLTVLASQAASPPYEAVSKTAKFTLGYLLLNTEETSITSSKPTAYPNPAKDMLQIRSGKGAGGEANISLYDLNGEKQNAISSRNGNDYQLDISELPSGIYSLKMTYCNEVFTQKVVKQ